MAATPELTGPCSLWLPKSLSRRVICEASYGGWAFVGHVDFCIYSAEILLGGSGGKGHSRQREQRLRAEGGRGVVNESPVCIPGVA